MVLGCKPRNETTVVPAATVSVNSGTGSVSPLPIYSEEIRISTGELVLLIANSTLSEETVVISIFVARNRAL